MKPRLPLSVALALAALGSLVRAQEVSALRVETRDGQTFLTWNESPVPGTSYRVYRSRSKFTSDTLLAQADLLGEVDDQSSRNDVRSLATGAEHGWVIQAGAAELSPSQGLFVYTIAEASVRSFYAVTSVRNGVEDRRLLLGGNTSTSSLLEKAAAPQPVLQLVDASGELWGHWVSDRDSPFLPALAPWPSMGFNFRFEPGNAAGPHGLALVLHAAGQTYGQGWPHRFEVQNDVDLLDLSDTQPFTNFSFWFGAHERFPDQPTSDTRIWNYTQQRVLWTLDWMSARLGPDLDPERVYAVGGSLGAIGAMLLAGEAPDRFAAILCRNGLYDVRAEDYRNRDIFQRLYGRFDLGLKMPSGLPVLDRLHARFMANRNRSEDWPVIRTISGRNDETVGWSSAVDLFAGLAEAHRPAVHYFDERTHMPQGYWATLERALLARTFQVRRDRPSLRFERCTLDDDPGDGTRTDGDPVGAINAYVEYDPRTASATASGLDFDVYLRDNGFLDDSPSATGWARLTPRRTGPFGLTPGERIHYTLRRGATIVDEHVLTVDPDGLVHTPLVPLERIPRTARFERWSPDATHLFLGAGPISGDFLQAVVSGTPGAAWSLTLGLGTSSGAPFARPGVDHVVLSGVFDATGLADVWLRSLPNLPAGSWLWGRVFTAGRNWPLHGVPIQIWP